jgi:pimeloyl-ACP methyl ester carboxylesterase
MKTRTTWLLAAFLLALPQAEAALLEQVVDIPTRPGVTQRLVLIRPEHSTAAVILFAGGHGGLQISKKGEFGWGKGNFLVRSRQRFAEQNLVVAVIDAPSDRLSPPYLSGFRQTPEHAADIKALIAWLRQQTHLPVWLIGTSRGTQSAAYVATRLSGHDGPDGIVLTSSILQDSKSRPVTDMSLETVAVPVLVVHHEQDGCKLCRPEDLPRLLNKLTATPRKELLTFKGGQDRGDPCEAYAHHGFNGLEPEVVAKIAAWIRGK